MRWIRRISSSTAVAAIAMLASSCSTPSDSGRSPSTTDPSNATLSEKLRYNPLPRPTATATMQVSSPDIADGSVFDMKYVFNEGGCTGENVVPSLEWSGAPRETKSFAITMYDPNAPTGSGFWHWIAADIPGTATSFKVGDPCREFLNDYGTSGYGGPCPPPGPAHTYVFTVYALGSERLEVPDGTTNAFARFAITTSALAYGSFSATFGQVS